MPAGAGDGGRVEKRVVVHQVALVGIAAPDPAIAFDAIDKKLPGVEV